MEYDREAEALLAMRTGITGGRISQPIPTGPFLGEYIGEAFHKVTYPMSGLPPQPGDEVQVAAAGISLAPLIPWALAAAGGYIASELGEPGAGVFGEVLGGAAPAAANGPKAAPSGVVRTTSTSPVPLGGPGLPEPDPRYIVWQKRNVAWGHTWNTYRLNVNGRTWMACWSDTKGWSFWKPAKHIVISRNPRIKTLGVLAKLNKRVEKMLKPYQPKPKKVTYGQLPARLLSAAEKQLVKG